MPQSIDRADAFQHLPSPDPRQGLDRRGREIFERTLRLVTHPSVTGTPGEAAIAGTICDEIQTWPYFRAHPEYLRLHPVTEDPAGRQSVIALVKGEATPSAATVVYLGHFDTVGIGEYGELVNQACDPVALATELARRELPEEVRNDLASGEWIFGRGVADMKGGVAVLMQLLKEAAEGVAHLSGNLLLVVAADEEADSRGMLSLAKPLTGWMEREHLDLVGAINTDVVCPVAGDSEERRAMYLGAMGKIVPAVYAVGKEAHVGEGLEGFDANFLLSELTCRIDCNLDLSDRYEEMVTCPPLSLKQTDLKDRYNGQVPFEGVAYYNFLNYRRGPAAIVELMRREVEASFRTCLQKLQTARQRFGCSGGDGPDPPGMTHRILTYDELLSRGIDRRGRPAVETELAAVVKAFGRETELELRDLSLALVRALWRLSGLTGPAAVIFIMPPYYPPNAPENGDEKFARFNRTVRRTAAGFARETRYPIEVRPFFPYLSDASFCSYGEGEGDRLALEANMPCWGKGWRIDIDNVRKLNLAPRSLRHERATGADREDDGGVAGRRKAFRNR
jgi:arginine utilization protein RocB